MVALIVEAKPPAQAEIVPLRLAKMNRAFVVVPGLAGFGSWKLAAFVLLTCPVGPCGGCGPVVGMSTKPCAFTAITFVATVPIAGLTAYSVLVLLPWFDTQNGLVGLRDMPQGFISFDR